MKANTYIRFLIVITISIVLLDMYMGYKNNSDIFIQNKTESETEITINGKSLYLEHPGQATIIYVNNDLIHVQFVPFKK